MDEKTILLLFTQRIYPEINAEPEREIINRLHITIFTDTDDIDARTIVLLSLAKSANILTVIFGKKEIKQRKKRIEQIVNGDIAGKATKEAIDAMQAAVMVACIMPAIMTTTMNANHYCHLTVTPPLFLYGGKNHSSAPTDSIKSLIS